ncbi:MAG: hypothetical protein RLY57_443 [Candidatus Parcubacteria bacterium]|jgi:uncharacterized protein YdhG (YjbR/CyaY superfamily)
MKNHPENHVDQYIRSAPQDMQTGLLELRALIQKVAPTATERTDYFQMPGYSYDECAYYNGMFVWFSFKKPYVRLHLLPQAIEKYKKEVKQYQLTKSIIGFRIGEKIPKVLVKKLVKESGNSIKALSKVQKK